jgi:hypothetical protein
MPSHKVVVHSRSPGLERCNLWQTEHSLFDQRLDFVEALIDPVKEGVP